MKLINGDEKSGAGRDALTEMGGSMPLFDDIDHNFDKDKLTPEVAEELRKFIAKKTENQEHAFNQSADFTELVKESLMYF